MRIAESGSRRNATDIAPMHTGIATDDGKPGRWDNAMPPAAPMNIAGNVGPPRKDPREIPHAMLLKSTRKMSVPTESVACVLHERSQRVLSREQHRVRASARDLREHERHQRDHETGGRDHDELSLRNEVRSSQPKFADRIREERGGDPDEQRSSRFRRRSAFRMAQGAAAGASRRQCSAPSSASCR